MRDKAVESDIRYLLHATLEAFVLFHRFWGLTVSAHGTPENTAGIQAS